MIPSFFVTLESLPLTPNGKVDRRGLPAPDISAVSETTFVPPSNPTEELLAAIWSQILGIEKIGIHDNFFELGGHSLKGTQVISGIRETFGVELPLRHLFSDPTVAELAEVIDATIQTSGTVEAVEIKPRTVDAVLTLSFAQERLWFLDKLEGESATYNMASAWRLEGTLCISALEAAVNEIIRRHEILRTTFKIENGASIQAIAPNATISLSIIDLQQLSAAEREAEVKNIVKQERLKPFDLESGPLLRVNLLQLGASSHVLTLTIHHIISDGWSMGILWRELSALYRAFSQGEQSPLAELPIQYADYALWQREWFEENLKESQLNYWKQQLADAPPLLELPADRPRPSIQSFTGQKQSLSLSESLSKSLKTLSKTEGVTIFMTLLAAFKLLLSRYAGSKEIVLGTPVAGRNRPEIEQLIGFFINTVVLRTDLDGNPTVRELLGRVREVTLGAYEHQEMPFEKLVEELHPERSGSYNPIFQVWFNLVNIETTKLELSNIKVEQLFREEAPAKFDLNVYVRESEMGIKLDLVYNADLFDAERMEELLYQYKHLLEQIVANPQAQIGSISLVTSKAEQLLPSPTKALKGSLSQTVLMHFSQQVQKHPDKLAVTDAQNRWSYAELEKRSNRLANYLLAKGIRRQDIVAIYANRSVSLVGAILAILKAGAAFTIVDPAYPTGRSIDCLGIARPLGFLQLTETSPPKELQDFVSSLSCSCYLQVTPNLLLNNISSDVPEVAVKPDDLAYVAFTSGSTGKPKGIKGTHKPLYHFLEWHYRQFNLHESDRFSMLSGLAHDPLLRDIFTPLCLGATSCIPEQKDIETPGQLACWMKQQEISVTHLTPAMAQLLSETSLQLPSLRYVFFGGDVLTGQDVVRMKKLAPSAKSVNFYGTTETPQGMGYFVIPDASNSGSVQNIQQIPLGRGIEDVQLLILNGEQQLAGIGELGEIYVRTPYLSQGYLGEEELTQERFIVNPFTKVESDRLYKTGDLARYLPDGNVEYIERIDNQVKIRGFRIELGEIEATLAQHPEVKEAVVIAREDIPSDKRLVAYIVPEAKAPTKSELRSFLKQKLPDYMVPSAFVTLESLPLTPNGKIDRRALPAPDTTRDSVAKTFVAPRNSMELQLAQVWEGVLGIQPIGVTDDFFELGGHSLLAVRLVAEIEKALQKKLSLAALFEFTTIAELTERLLLEEVEESLTLDESLPPLEPEDFRALLTIVGGREGTRSRPDSLMVGMRTTGLKPPLFCCANAVREISTLADVLGSEQPFYLLESGYMVFRGEHNEVKGKRTEANIQALAARHVRDLEAVHPEGPYLLAGYSFGRLVAYEIAKQLQERGKKVAMLAMLDTPGSGWMYHYYGQKLQSILMAMKKELLRGSLLSVARQSGSLLWELLEDLRTQKSLVGANKGEYLMQGYPGKITLFVATERMAKRYIKIRHRLFPAMGWEGHLVERIEVPGDHSSMLAEPHVRVLADKLKTCIDKAVAAI